MHESDWNVLKSSFHGDDVPIKLSYSETSGRGLVATRKIAPNEIIFEEPPLVLGPNPRTNPSQANSHIFCIGCSAALSPISLEGNIHQ